MKLKTTLHITSFALACTLVVAVVPSQADVSNTGYLMVAKDQTRDRDRLRDRSCLDAIDAARAAMDRNRIREAKKEMDRARNECDGDQDRNRDRDRDKDHDKDQDKVRDRDRKHQ